MKKLFSILLVLVLVLDARAATIIGDMTLLFGDSATNNAFSVSGLDLPMNYNGRTYFASTVSGQLTNGQLNVTLTPPGRYNISFFGLSTSIRIVNPANTNTYDISQMLTNVLVLVNQGISKYVQPGSGVVFTTNNAGLASEYITITSLGSGGVASNAYQLEIASAGLSLSTNALSYIYSLSLNANLTNWSAISPSSKQDALGYIPQPASANGSNWAALATSAKQDALGYIPQPASANGSNWAALATSAKQDALGYIAANTNFATTSVPGLAFPDGTTIVIDPTTHKWSSVATGTGDFVGPAGATSGHIMVFGSGTGKLGADSGHALSEYTPLSQIASGSQNGVLSLSDWTMFNSKPSTATAVLTNDLRNITLGGALTNSTGVILPGTPLGDTNAAPSRATVIQDILNNTINLGPLAPPSGIYIIGLGPTTNTTPVHLGTGLTYDSATSNLNATGSGGSVTALPATNIWPSSTNIFLIDPKLSRTWNVGLITNVYARFTNIFDLTNFPNELVINTHQDTNGTWRFLGVDVAGALFKTNIGSAFGVTTQATAEDQILCRLDWTGTNIYAKIQTNIAPQTPSTNSLASGGGGGGGGGSWVLVAHTNAAAASAGATASLTLDTTGAKFLAMAVMWAGGGPVVQSDGKGNTWGISSNYVANNPKVQWYYVTNATGKVGSGHTFSASCTGVAVAIDVYAFSCGSGQPTLDGESAGNRTGGWLGNTILAGSITPSTNNDIFLGAATWDVNGTSIVTNNAGFLYPDPLIYAGNGLMAGYKIHVSDGTAENPGWLQGTTGNNCDADFNHIAFKLNP